MDINLWLFQLEAYFTYTGKISIRKVPFAATLLRGGATSWWRALVVGGREPSD